MSDPSIAIQDALIAAIRGLATAAGARVFGQMQLERPDYPYVTVWPGTGTPVDEACFDRTETVLQIDVWADTKTYIRVKEIAGQIRTALHEQKASLVVDGHVVDRVRVDAITTFPPSPTYRSMITLSIETQPAA